MSLSDYLENALVNAVLRNTAYTSPATVYLAAFTTDPTDADVGAEVSGMAYVRQAITFGAPSNGVCLNSAQVTFPVASGNWGTITHVGVYDASTAGNLLWSGALTTPRNISGSGLQLVFPIGDLSVSLA